MDINPSNNKILIIHIDLNNSNPNNKDKTHNKVEITLQALKILYLINQLYLIKSEYLNFFKPIIANNI